MEIAVVEPDSPKPDRRLQAHCLVDFLAQACERVRRRHGHGQDQLRGATAPHGLQRDPHRRTGGDAVIDYDRGTSGDFPCWAPFAISITTPLDLFEPARGFVPDIALRNTPSGRQIVVDKRFRTGSVGHRAEGQLGLPGDPDFLHEYDVEWGIESLGYLEADRDTAARQRQDDRLRLFQVRELASKTVAGLTAIRELHAPTSSRSEGNQPRTRCASMASDRPSC